MKLLIITQKYDNNDPVLGAFNIWWDKLAQHMSKVYILALEKRSETSLSNVKVISMGKEKDRGFFGKIFGFYWGLFKTIGRIDAIFIHMIPKYVILAAPLAFIFRKPIYFWYAGIAAQKQLKFAAKFCKKIFTSHEAGMRARADKRVVVGHGIDVNKFTPRLSEESGTITVISVGRITPSKGHAIILEAIADLICEGYNLRLEIIGGVIQRRHEPYLSRLKKMALEFGVRHRIEFIGPVPYNEMPQYFHQAEILVNAVPFGSLDKVILEAMASCIVPLTSNSAFLGVFPGEFSKELIFKEGSWEDLKMKLKNILDKKLYKNETLCQQMREIIIKNYNLDNLIIRFLKEMSE